VLLDERGELGAVRLERVRDGRFDSAEERSVRHFASVRRSAAARNCRALVF
jgi:hypothetical protein